ncbi:hypothetical protein LINGRAPRIM_LOCUS2294 [Linum grandiflorum]
MDVPYAWFWHYTNDGLYTVASGYRLAQSICPAAPSKPGPSLLDPHIWAKVWGSPVQPKLKLFLWKIFHNILPLQDTLAARGISLLPSCPVCHSSEETVQHFLIGCTVATQLATMVGCPIFVQNDIHPVTLWRGLSRVDTRASYKLIYFWWRLWKARNSVVFNLTQFSIPNLARKFA